jgi:hypothetical protein
MAKKNLDNIDDSPGKGEEEELRRTIAEAKETEPDAPTVINVDEIDDDEPAPRNRDEARSNRYWMNKKQREEYEENIRRRDEQIANLQQQMQYSIQQQQQQLLQQRVAPQAEVRDPIDEEVSALSRKLRLIREDYALKAQQGRATPEETARLTEEFEKTELQIMEKMAQKATRSHAPQGDPQLAAIKAHIDITYPDVVKNPAAIQWAAGYEKQQMAMGRNPSPEETMEATRKAFRIGKHAHTAPRTPPTYMADRLSGTPRGANGGNGDAPRQVTMTRELKKMANAAFPKIRDERKRYEAFAKLQAEED